MTIIFNEFYSYFFPLESINICHTGLFYNSLYIKCYQNSKGELKYYIRKSNQKYILCNKGVISQEFERFVKGNNLNFEYS